MPEIFPGVHLTVNDFVFFCFFCPLVFVGGIFYARRPSRVICEGIAKCQGGVFVFFFFHSPHRFALPLIFLPHIFLLSSLPSSVDLPPAPPLHPHPRLHNKWWFSLIVLLVLWSMGLLGCHLSVICSGVFFVFFFLMIFLFCYFPRTPYLRVFSFPPFFSLIYLAVTFFVVFLL